MSTHLISALTAVAGLAAGLVLGLWLGSANDAQFTDVAGRPSADAERKQEPQPLPAASSAGLVPAAAVEASAPREPRSRLASEIPDGQALLRVSVIAPDGARRNGADVVVREASDDDDLTDDPGDQGRESTTLESQVYEHESGWEDDSDITGSTDPAGRFAAIVRPGQRYWVLTDDDLLHGVALVTARAQATDVEVRLGEPVLQSVRGAVRSVHGKPVAGARVRIGWEDGAHIAATTGADGRYDVSLPRPGAHQVEVKIAARGFAAASARFPNRWSGPTHQRVDAILAPVARVRGAVRMRDGGAIPPDTRIAYRLLPERFRLSWAYLADGRFSIDLEKSGEVFVRATGLEVRHTEVSAGRVELGKERQLSLVVDRVPTARVATLDPDGRPVRRGGLDGLSHQHRIGAWLVPDRPVHQLPAYGGPSRVFYRLRESAIGGTRLPVEADGTVRVPLGFEGHRWLVVAANRGDHAPARVRVSAASVPSSVRLRRLVAVLDAALDVVGGGRTFKVQAVGTWDDGTESGPFVRELRGRDGRTTHMRVLRPDTGRPARISLTLQLPGYPPRSFKAESLAATSTLPVDIVRFERE